MVREWEEQESRYLRLYLDNTRTASSSDDQQDPIVEQVISIATSLVLTRLAAGQGIHLAVRGKVGPSVAPGTSPDRLLRFLALLDYAPRDATPAFPQLPHGEAILVTAEAQNFDGAIIAALPPGQSPRGA